MLSQGLGRQVRAGGPSIRTHSSLWAGPLASSAMDRISLHVVCFTCGRRGHIEGAPFCRKGWPPGVGFNERRGGGGVQLCAAVQRLSKSQGQKMKRARRHQ